MRRPPIGALVALWLNGYGVGMLIGYLIGGGW
jgi:hypothetical protein